jgi:hypothetical protein
MSEIQVNKGVITAPAGSTAQTELGRDVSSVIWHETDSRNTPIISLLGGKLFQEGDDKESSVPAIIKKEAATEYKYDVIEKDALGRSWVGGAAVASTSEETVPFASAAGIDAGMILRKQDKDTPEVIMCITYTSSTEIEAKRNLGSTAYEIAGGDTWKCVGFAQKDGGSKRGVRTVIAAARTRYLQVQRNTFGITMQLQNSDEVVNVKAWSEEMKIAAREHNLDKEGTFWYGPNADSTTDSSSNTVFLARGILQEIRQYNSGSNVVNLQGSMDEDSFLGNVMEQIFAKGASKKMGLLDGRFLSKIMGFAVGKQQLQPSMQETPYGLAIGTLVSVHGILKIVHQGVSATYNAASEAGFGLVLEPDRCVYKYLQNMDNRYEEGIQTPGDLVKEAQFYSVCGASLRNRSHHFIVENIG